MFAQPLAPTGSLLVASLIAVIPLVVLLALLAVFKVKAHIASAAALLTCMGLAISVWHMPLMQAIGSASFGAANGVLSILWLVVNAIWIHNMTVASGDFENLRRVFGTLSADLRIATIIIAFAFGTLLEALAGGGAPVAICAVMLISLGVAPIKAVVAALVADTAPVAFGGMGNPITILARSVELSDRSKISAEAFGAMVGRQTSVLSILVPFALLLIIDGRRGIKDAWPAALIAGLAFGGAQYFLSNHFAYELTDIFAAIISTIALIVLLRLWQPKHEVKFVDVSDDAVHISIVQRIRAFAPYVVVVVIFSLAQLPAMKDGLAKLTFKFAWPELAITNAAGSKVGTDFVANIGSSAGTLLFVAGIVTMLILRIRPLRGAGIYGSVFRQFGWAAATILLVFALSFVMNFSGMVVTLGTALATSGALFALLSPVVGWAGVFITGTDAGANALFGQLQVTAAEQIGVSPVLLGAANTTGGVMGKMISPQNLAVGAAAIAMVGKEGDILRKVLPWSLGFLVLTCVLVYLQSTPALGWMVG